MSLLVVGLCALAFLVLLLALFQWSHDDGEPAFDAALRVAPPPATEEPPSLQSARWLVVNASTAGGLHFRVRPVLVELTEARLHDRHGIDMTHAAAPAVLGDALWEIVRADASPPGDRMAPGLTPSMLRAVLDRLENL